MPETQQEGNDETKSEGENPEWADVFEDLKKKAEDQYPNGRVKIIVPKRKKKNGEGVA